MLWRVNIAQEIATVMRQHLNPIFVILNNGTYAVEEVRTAAVVYAMACMFCSLRCMTRQRIFAVM